MRSERIDARGVSALAIALLVVLAAPGAGAVCIDVAELRPMQGAELALDDAGDGLGGTGLGEGDDDGIGGTGLKTGTDGIGGTGLGTDTDGIGGTGIHANADGIGGTGRQASTDGIGGTGLEPDGEGSRLLELPGMSDDSLDHVRAAGDTLHPGLLHPDSMLARIVSVDDECAAGTGLALATGARIEEGLDERTASDLRVGHVAWIETEIDGDGAVATLVALRPIVEGPVDGIDLTARRIEVMGEQIDLAPGARVENEDDGRALDVGSIGLGDSVVVHGVRDGDGRIRATYVGLRARSPFARVQGIVAPDPTGEPGAGLRVGGVRIAATIEGVGPVGHWVEVRGRWDARSRALVDARVVESGRGQDESAPKGTRSGSRLHLGQQVPVSTR